MVMERLAEMGDKLVWGGVVVIDRSL